MKRRNSSNNGGTPKMPSQRQLRVGERIRHILSTVFQREEFHDPILAKSRLLTVTGVDISPDLKNATVYILPLGMELTDELLATLNNMSGFFRTRVSAELETRHTPRLIFKKDHSFDQASHIESLLQDEKVKRDVAKTDEDE